MAVQPKKPQFKTADEPQTTEESKDTKTKPKKSK